MYEKAAKKEAAKLVQEGLAPDTDSDDEKAKADKKDKPDDGSVNDRAQSPSS
jgi:hypothetical protein